MRLQADDSLRPDMCIMDNAGGQIEPITGVQGELLVQLRQAKGDATLHDLNNFIIAMRVRRIDIEGSV